MENVKSWSWKSVDVAVRRTDLDPGEEKDSGDCQVERVSGRGGRVEVLVSVETAHLGDEMVGRRARQLAEHGSERHGDQSAVDVAPEQTEVLEAQVHDLWPSITQRAITLKQTT